MQKPVAALVNNNLSYYELKNNDDNLLEYFVKQLFT